MLLDKFFSTGKDYSEFKEIICQLDKGTYLVDMNLSDVELMSLEKDDADSVILFKHTKQVKTQLRKEEIEKKPEGSELFEELLKTKTLLFNGGLYFCSEQLQRDLSARAKCFGAGMSIPSKERNAFLSKNYSVLQSTAKAVVRHQEGLKKIIALPSSEYVYIPQTTILEIVDNLSSSMGDFEVVGWEVSNFFTSITIRFKEKSEDFSKTFGLPDTFVPGIFIRTSDSGDSSFEVQSFWEKRNSLVKGNVVSKKHQGKVSVSKLETEVKEKIFDKYISLPNRLCELLALDIDMSKIEKLVADIMKKYYVKAGKKISKEVVIKAVDYFKSIGKLTAYDIYNYFFELSSKVIAEAYVIDEIQKASSQVQNFEFEKYI